MYFSVAMIAALIVSFPFAYATDQLTGVRHDTREYEVDALLWAESCGDSVTLMQSDERISYVGTALMDFEKMPYLPSRLMKQEAMGANVFYVIEDEWTTSGVNNYPYGHPVMNETWVNLVFSSSHVVYLGGPQDNRISIFMWSIEGQERIIGTL